MPGTEVSGKLFFEKMRDGNGPLSFLRPVDRVSLPGVNRTENSPDQIEAGEPTSRRGRRKDGDAGA
jgi:hypothetical protein